MGLIASLFHLGRPAASFHAIRNLKGSWLSREILSVNLLAGLLAIVTALTYVCPGVLNGWLMLMGSLAGGAVVYVMTRVYRLRTVPSWNHAGTPLDFAGSALLLGGLQFMLVLSVLTVNRGVTHDASGTNILRIIPLIAVLVGFMLKVLAAGVNPFGRKDSAGLFKTSQPVLQGCGTVLLAVSMASGIGEGFQAALLYVAAVSLLAGETLHRVLFYDSHHSGGL
jgi:anaerobic dimethyl sulfoxide reductase subunit C (anchor subunit)